jgi:hypothetical protein
MATPIERLPLSQSFRLEFRFALLLQVSLFFSFSFFYHQHHRLFTIQAISKFITILEVHFSFCLFYQPFLFTI